MINMEKDSVEQNSAGLGQPLRVPVFRNLLIADLVSDIGTFMQSVGAAWLMVTLHAGPGYVALIQTAASLPCFLFALPAGSAGDIFEFRFHQPVSSECDPCRKSSGTVKTDK